MKSIYILLAVMSLISQASAQSSSDSHGPDLQGGDVSYAPLLLFTNGLGRIFPFQDGQELEVGREYAMVAIPDRGYTFTNWNPVYVFTSSFSYTNGNLGLTNVVTTLVEPVPEFTRDRVLRFAVQAPEVIFGGGDTNILTLTESFGWQANFVARGKPHRENVGCEGGDFNR